SAGQTADLNFDHEKQLIQFLLQGAKRRLFASARDLSIGGLSAALARSVLSRNFDPRATSSPRGFALSIAEPYKSDLDLTLFGETNGCAIVTVKPGSEAQTEALAKASGIPLWKIGTVSSDAMFNYGGFQISYEEAAAAYEGGLAGVF
ncbi:MAG TPA: AIR synthase-related protein, partial [Leptospiraceae bacterium]|nr:AIR synthase-related protein [Leptospiraceae bacterium]